MAERKRRSSNPFYDSFGSKKDLIFTLEKEGTYKRVLVEDVPLDYMGKLVEGIPKPIRDLMAQNWKYIGLRKKGPAPSSKSQQAPGKKRAKENKVQDTKTIAKWQEEVSQCVEILESILQGTGKLTRIIDKYNIDPVGLAKSYVLGQNPLDYLSRCIEPVRRPTIMISPDTSGSCSQFSEFTLGFAETLKKKFDIEYVENFNGLIRHELMPKTQFDLLVYLGDKDILVGKWMRQQEKEIYTSMYNMKEHLIVLDNEGARHTSKPLHSRKHSTTRRCWIEFVDFKKAKSYVKALELVRKNMSS